MVDPLDSNRVHWRPISEIAGQCDWDIVNNSGSEDLVMGFDDACNEGRVGIGVEEPSAKLHIAYDMAGSTDDVFGIREQIIGGQSTNIGNYLIVSVPVFDGGTSTYGNYTRVVGGETKNVAGYFTCESGIDGQDAVGCVGVATGDVGTALNNGVRGDASFAKFNLGVFGNVLSDEESWASFGVTGSAVSIENNLDYWQVLAGVQGVVNLGADEEEFCGYDAYAIWGRVLNDQEESCEGDLRYAGLFDGDAEVLGDLTVGGVAVLLSDENLKQNIEGLSTQTQNFMQLNPVSFNWNNEVDATLHFDSELHTGFIAQQIQEIYPDMVREITTPGVYDNDGYKIEDGNTYMGIKYDEMIPVTVKAVQELYATVIQQGEMIRELQTQVESCCSSNEERSDVQITGPHEDKIILKNNDVPMLGFASPNPNHGSVGVSYFVPVSNKEDAEILFTDMNGRLINSYKISQFGDGRLIIDTNELSSGQYQYTLIVNGEVISTRKMIRQ